MLSLLISPFIDQEEEEGLLLFVASDLHHQHRQQRRQPPLKMRQLLISCAELVSQSDFPAAIRLLSILSSSSSPSGDSIERLVYQFVKALSLRINRLHHHHHHHGLAGSSLMRMMNDINFPITSTAGPVNVDPSLQSCYLSLNQITPFIRFAHLTANQAILEAIQVGQQCIHIIDFDIMHGVQWPPLMQAFEFHPLLVLNEDPTWIATNFTSMVTILPDEALAVNCMLYLQRLLKDDSRDIRLFLHHIKALNPTVVTVAEREANHNHPLFLQRFVEALDYYTAIFDSLEATLPPNSRERLAVEQIWFGREIVDIVAAEGENRRERHERLETWEVILRSSGFINVPLSPFAHSQAKLLLRLHYPSEGYQLQIVNNCFFLGWQNRPLFSVSSWR
ncbi:hypothetical protein Golax_023642 [Gossypium laxum]|uniref:Scarecrow-like protein 18 n=1 Tax=Gossypium laxum TaxID=34288 RepID=A0A7J8ZB09_9ROSI|nr:hypothetical protein [Gossypium laxum]